jgi:hypothetical protein
MPDAVGGFNILPARLEMRLKQLLDSGKGRKYAPNMMVNIPSISTLKINCSTY